MCAGLRSRCASLEGGRHFPRRRNLAVTNLLEGSLERPHSEPYRLTLEVSQEADILEHMGNTTHGESVQPLQSVKLIYQLCHGQERPGSFLR